VAGYPVRLRPQVEDEVREAMRWYRNRVPGLEKELYAASLEGVSAIAEAPEAYRKVRGEVRRIVLTRFPYLLFYLFERESDSAEVVVLPFTHERRSPDRWPTS